LASALAEGRQVELNVGGVTVHLRVPDGVRSEFEVEVDGAKLEVELELK
jgi:amphi-Trp domain-containing protein